MRPRDLERDLHPSVVTARHLRALADLWAPLHEALRPGGGNTLTGRVTGTPGKRLPIDAHVSDVIAETGAWVHFWARVLADETDWTPPADRLLTVPRLLEELAQRVGHFVMHPDQALAQAFIEEAADTRRRCEHVVAPTGRRKVKLKFACLETVDDKPCPGEYYAPLNPDDRWAAIPDMVCSADRTHRISPDVWQRLQRKNLDEGAARRFLAAIKGETTATDNLRTTRREKRAG